MTNFWLKMIAVTTMLLDHIGAFMFAEEFIPFRIIGRLAFPIFAFLLTEGYAKTSNKGRYLFRLGIFALISEIPFNLVVFNAPYRFTQIGDVLSPTFMAQNIYFTLFIGLAGIIIYEYYIEKRIKEYAISTWIIAMIIATLAMTDYSAYGVAMIFIFHLFKKGDKKLIFSLIIINILMSYVTANYIQSVSILALFPIFYYNHEKGYSNKWLQYGFYIFYPVHLLILYALK